LKFGVLKRRFLQERKPKPVFVIIGLIRISSFSLTINDVETYAVAKANFIVNFNGYLMDILTAETLENSRFFSAITV